MVPSRADSELIPRADGQNDYHRLPWQERHGLGSLAGVQKISATRYSARHSTPNGWSNHFRVTDNKGDCFIPPLARTGKAASG